MTTHYRWAERGRSLVPVGGGDQSTSIVLFRPQTFVELFRERRLEGESCHDGIEAGIRLQRGGPEAVAMYLRELRGELKAESHRTAQEVGAR